MQNADLSTAHHRRGSAEHETLKAMSAYTKAHSAYKTMKVVQARLDYAAADDDYQCDGKGVCLTCARALQMHR